MARLILDPRHPPRLTAKEKARLDAMTGAKITKAAKSDADNPPLTDKELARLKAARRVREVRAHTGLSQASFAKMFRINVARLRDLEQGRTQPDSALLAYLAVIAKNPELVRRALRNAD
jgi:putative transcriptional regulator